MDGETKQRHWAKTRNLTFLVLAIWFIFSIIIPWNAKALMEYSFLGFPLGYYFPVTGFFDRFCCVDLLPESSARQD